MIKIALDMMGSDFGAVEFIKGIKMYLAENKEVQFICCGNKEELKELEGLERVEILPTTEIVPMKTDVLKFLRMKDSSMYRALELVKEGTCQGLVTAGSTGGFLAGSTLMLKNVKGVNRAGFCAPFPTAIKGKQTCILDIGASNTNTGEELVTFAKLGSIYAKEILHIASPSVYLLSNGAEEGKGLEETKEAYEILSNQSDVNFLGNVEARDCLDGHHDVIVSTGYPGNIFLKATEGCALMMNGMIKKAFKRNLLSKIGYLFAKKGFVEMKETMDYRKTGGAILLGINGVAIKTHGNSDAKFFYYSMDLAYRMIKADIVSKIGEAFKDEKR